MTVLTFAARTQKSAPHIYTHALKDTHTQMMKTSCALSLGLSVNISFLSVAYGCDLLLLGRETNKSLIVIGRKMSRYNGKRSLLSYYIGEMIQLCIFISQADCICSMVWLNGLFSQNARVKYEPHWWVVT